MQTALFRAPKRQSASRLRTGRRGGSNGAQLGLYTDSAGANSARLGHSRYHTELAAAASTGLTGPDPGTWSKAIHSHLDDLRAAHTWSLQHEPDLAMRLAAALY